MPKKSNTRSAQGSGTLRQRKDGLWEGRYSAGRDPATGRQIQRSVYDISQQECRKKLAAKISEIDTGAYIEPSQQLLSQWLDDWTANYLVDVKPRTVDSYKSTVKNHLKPKLGNNKLQAIKPAHVQKFVNAMISEGLSPKTVKNHHGVLHAALQQARMNGLIRDNPSDLTRIPKIQQPEIKPLDDEGLSAFLSAIRGHEFEALFFVAVTTGMRQSELIGLSWNNINFSRGTILVSQQLQKNRSGDGYQLVTPKNGKSRLLTPAKSVMHRLEQHQQCQTSQCNVAESLWDNPYNLVFTTPFGRNICASTLQQHFKRIAISMGLPDMRFHDLRHSYACACLRAGDTMEDIKESLGHYSSSFTSQVYIHYTNNMRKDSSDRMEAYLQKRGV